ncbi:LVIVD repeat-containing protein [Nafulsella turpanensis]|uniref:hypothetical protein n=1 Tax=Nafulsella turpanensis TaxID=1265690 RepID=UPI00034BFC5A|nr:hypothetical protein [Nafulsella turpanensis]
MKKALFLPLLLFAFLLGACEPTDEQPEEVMGLRPVYGSAEDLEVHFLPAQEICQPGKIYRYGQYLLVNELHEGIHMIDNTDPAAPQLLGFVKIAGNVDMAVKDNFIYADHLSSMVVLDMSNPAKVRFVKAVEKAFDYGHNRYPSQTGVYFECVDPSKGPVIGWAEALLQNPQCFR